MEQIAYEDFAKIDMRAGRIVEVVDFERARTPAYKLRIDFGDELGERWTSAQAKLAYRPDELFGRLVVAVVNFPPKNIAGFMSEVLVLGVQADDGSLSLLEPSRGARLGSRVH
ncbi:MAG TPA: tRNA-binding protein [Actinomycetota bacterium]|nr:tRNA-binding protein [Actinomycetota bacterium]